MSKSKSQKSINPEKPTDCVTEDEVREVLLEQTNLVSYCLNNDQRAQIFIERQTRNGLFVIRTVVVGMPPAASAATTSRRKKKDSSAAAANSGSHIAAAANFTGVSVGKGALKTGKARRRNVCLCKQLGANDE